MYSNILKRELHFDDSGHERLNVYRLDCRYPAEEDFNYFKAGYITPGYSATAMVTATNTLVEINQKNQNETPLHHSY